MAVKHSPVVKVMIYAAIAFILVAAGLLVWSVLGGPALSEEALPVDKPPVTEEPLPADEPAPEPEPTPLPPIPTNFIVADEIWESATFLLWEGKVRKNSIFFPDIPVGTRLYAPISGYLTMVSVGEEEGYFGLYIGEAGSNNGRYVYFIVQELNLIDVGHKNGNPFVQKGQPFAEVSKNTELFPGNYKEKPQMMLFFRQEWADMVDESITDPRKHVWAVIQVLREGE